MEVTGPDAVRVLVATEAKRNQDVNSSLDREFHKSFLDVSSLTSYSPLYFGFITHLFLFYYSFN